MWIALGIIGALWFAGMVIWPDKNAPPQTANPPAHTAVAQTTPAPPAQDPHAR
jgi:hypothetical protein